MSKTALGFIIVVAAAVLTASLIITSHVAANQPNAGLEFSLHVGSCNTVGDQKGNCTLSQGSAFVVSVSLDDISGLANGAYGGLGAKLVYTGVTSTNAFPNYPMIIWPDCRYNFFGFGAGWVWRACAGVPYVPPSTYTGTVFTFDFECASDGTISLLYGGEGDTMAYDANNKPNNEAGPDVLNINCGNPVATPTPSPTATPTSNPTMTPTPGPVGGVSFDSAARGSRSSRWFAALFAVLGCAALGAAAWRSRWAA